MTELSLLLSRNRICNSDMAPNCVGIRPEIKLLFKYNCCNLLKNPICVGIFPFNRLYPKFTFVNALANVSCTGTGPVRRLLYPSKYPKSFNTPTPAGIGPPNPLSRKENDTSLLSGLMFGIVPLNLLSPIHKKVKAVNSDKVEGKVPEIEFVCKAREFNRVSWPIQEDKLPVKRESARFNPITLPVEPQVMADQYGTPLALQADEWVVHAFAWLTFGETLVKTGK